MAHLFKVICYKSYPRKSRQMYLFNSLFAIDIPDLVKLRVNLQIFFFPSRNTTNFYPGEQIAQKIRVCCPGRHQLALYLTQQPCPCIYLVNCSWICRLIAICLTSTPSFSLLFNILLAPPLWHKLIIYLPLSHDFTFWGEILKDKSIVENNAHLTLPNPQPQPPSLLRSVPSLAPLASCHSHPCCPALAISPGNKPVRASLETLLFHEAFSHLHFLNKRDTHRQFHAIRYLHPPPIYHV